MMYIKVTYTKCPIAIWIYRKCSWHIGSVPQLWTSNSTEHEIHSTVPGTQKALGKFFLSSCCKEPGRMFFLFCPRSSICKTESASFMFRSWGAMEMSVKLTVTQMTKAKERSGLFSNHDLLLPLERCLQMAPVGRGSERLHPGLWGYSQQLQKDHQHPLSGYSADAKHLLVLPCILAFCWSTCSQLRNVLWAEEKV